MLGRGPKGDRSTCRRASVGKALARSIYKEAMFSQITQLIPSELCLECPVCCRFPEQEAGMSPFFFPKERVRAEGLCDRTIQGAFRQEGASKAALTPCGHGFACSFFNPADHTCGIYESRPLDCSIYPVVVMRGRDEKGVFVGADTKCPALERPEIAQRVAAQVESVRRFLESPDVSRLIREHPEFVGDYQEEARELRELSLERA